MGSEVSPVRVEIDRGVARVTMDSPHNRNALSGAMIDGLIDAVAGAVADPSVRLLMLTHAGPVFCSGADLKETAAALAARMGQTAAAPTGPTGPGAGPTGPEAERTGSGAGPTGSGAGPTGSGAGPTGSGAGPTGSGAGPTGSGAAGRGAAAGGPGAVPAARLGELLAAIRECPKPVLARIAGPARAGGLGLIAAADIAVCAAEATFAFSEVRIGVVPAVISATVLPRLTSRAAAELYLTGLEFDGTRAARVGLVTAAVPAAELDAETDRYIDALRRGAPGAMAGVKSLLRREPAATLRDELDELTDLSVAYFGSAEGIEGMAAFRDKRDPAWVPEH